MTDREDRIVYVCGCDWPKCTSYNYTGYWVAADVGTTCGHCNQPVKAINIDQLQRDLAAKDRVIEGIAREALDAIGQLQRDLVAKERVVEAARDAKDAVAGSAYMTTGLRDDFNSHQRVATVEIGRILAALDAHDKEVGSE